MIRYYCSGFDINDAFGHGLGEMFKFELKDTKSIVYIPGSPEKIEKAKIKYIPSFTEHFKNVGIEFEQIDLITPDLLKEEAKEMISEASFIMLMGGDPFKQRDLCKQLDILSDLKQFSGVMLGFSAGAMLMSKHIIITPCSEEYPNFHIEEGLNLDDLSIYPHNNTSSEEYPDELIAGEEKYQKKDLIEVAQKFGKFYLLQDNLREDGLTDVSIIKSTDGALEFYYENDGKIWEVSDDVRLLTKSKNYKKNK
ncbi:MAG: Type 1 glutamine amidotransferase-like domain-containing protein [Clostridium sp.]